MPSVKRFIRSITANRRPPPPTADPSAEAGTPYRTVPEELRELVHLHLSGLIDDTEFGERKTNLLNSDRGEPR